MAEKASLAKSDFLSSMSHELRSPLNVNEFMATLNVALEFAGQKAGQVK